RSEDSTVFPVTPNNTNPTSRRDFLHDAGSGFGLLALTALLADEGLLGADETVSPVNPLAPKPPHRPATAQRVVFLFMAGGPSHLETFDSKPDLQRLHGQKLPPSFGPVKTRRGVDKNRLLATRHTFKKHGRSGIEVSDLLPHLTTRVDDLCV